MKAKNKKDKELKEVTTDNAGATNLSPDLNNNQNEETNHNSPDSSDSQTLSEIEENKTKDDLLQEIEELKDKNLRMMAEFDNFRKRNLKEKSDLIKYGGEAVLKDTITLVDDFERALDVMKTAKDVDAVKEGVVLIYNSFLNFLEKNGVKEIATENEVFNTDLHEAITTFPVEDKNQKGKIIDCTTKGYTLHDKVIRYAKVVVGE